LREVRVGEPSTHRKTGRTSRPQPRREGPPRICCTEVPVDEGDGRSPYFGPRPLSAPLTSQIVNLLTTIIVGRCYIVRIRIITNISDFEGGVCVGETASSRGLMEAHQHPVLQGLTGATRIGALRGPGLLHCYRLLRAWISSVSRRRNSTPVPCPHQYTPFDSCARHLDAFKVEAHCLTRADPFSGRLVGPAPCATYRFHPWSVYLEFHLTAYLLRTNGSALMRAYCMRDTLVKHKKGGPPKGPAS
jgi:hypothetical protein